MYSHNKRRRAVPVGTNKASTSRDDIHKSDIEAEAVHERLTGIDRAKFDHELHLKAKEITDAEQLAIDNGGNEDREGGMAYQSAVKSIRSRQLLLDTILAMQP